MKLFTQKPLRVALVMLGIAALMVAGSQTDYLDASSHREAPMIANDPLADNTDLYAFRSPDDPSTVTLIANYIPAELPNGGPNYYSFGENIRYEIHIKNNVTKNVGTDDIIYRFTFQKTNEDPTTFFNIRLGKENLKTTYVCERSKDGGKTFHKIITNGVVAPNNIGPRSIEGAVGLNTSYPALVQKSITKASTGETIFCGPVDDPFFVDLGGIFDLGNIRPDAAKDALKCKNVHTIAIKVPIKDLSRYGYGPEKINWPLDGDFIIGVWASASRPKMRVLQGDGTEKHEGPWVQVSRIGMPLTNEAVIPVGMKDYWNSQKPYNEKGFDQYFTNPELALYMDDEQFGGAVPGFEQLRIQRNSLQAFDFGNGKDGLSGLLGNPATKGTALDKALFGDYLLRKGQPRSVDLLPIFMTGVPNIAPYQLATGKGGNPLKKGKPLINNFLPTFGDMLRLNMAVMPTPRNSPDFNSLGLVYAAALGLTDPRFNTNTKEENIPNMDGFPNGRRLEDDVTRIELQAVSGVVLAAIGLWYDDYKAGDANVATQDLVDVLSFTTGVEANDMPFKAKFPYQADPANGYDECDAMTSQSSQRSTNWQSMQNVQGLNISAPSLLMQNYPNPASSTTTFKYRVGVDSKVTLKVYDGAGTLIEMPVKGELKKAGSYEVELKLDGKYKKGTYYATISDEAGVVQSLKIIVDK